MNEKQDSSIHNGEYDDYIDDFEKDNFLKDNLEDTKMSQNSVKRSISIEKLLKEDLIEEQSAKITSRHSEVSEHSEHESALKFGNTQPEVLIDKRIDQIPKADPIHINDNIKEIEVTPTESHGLFQDDVDEELVDSDEIIIEASKTPLNIRTKESSNNTLEIIDSQSEKEDSDSGSETIELNSDNEEPEYLKSIVNGNNVKSSFLIKLEVQNKKVKKRDVNLRITNQRSGSRKGRKRNILTDKTETDSVVESYASNKQRLGSRKLRFSDKYKYQNQTISDNAVDSFVRKPNVKNITNKSKNSHLFITNKHNYQSKYFYTISLI